LAPGARSDQPPAPLLHTPPVAGRAGPGLPRRVDPGRGLNGISVQRRLLQQTMSGNLGREIHQEKPFASLEEEAFLGLQRTASLLLQSLGRALKGHDLTPAQYNTLRILRGAEPDALTCGEIGDRLVSPGPDVTRLLDRLEQRGLVTRLRDGEDRRVVRARITTTGLDLLAALDEPVGRMLGELLGNLGQDRLRTLVVLLGEARNVA